MDTWTTELSPLAREKLNRAGDISESERNRVRELQKLDALLVVYFKGLLKGEALFKALKEMELEGKQYLLKEAKSRLESSFMRSLLPFKFTQSVEGNLLIDLLKTEEKLENQKTPVLELNEGNFDKAVNDHGMLVVDCWAPWCGPCRIMSPVIDELAATYKGKITFAKLNTDENQQISARYQVMAIPTLLIFKDGKLVDRKTGALPRQVLEAEFARYTE